MSNFHLTPYSLLIEPYKKGFIMMQEACCSPAQPKNFYGNRTIHFILGASLLIPMINTIITLVLNCWNKSQSLPISTTQPELKKRVNISTQKPLKDKTTKPSTKVLFLKRTEHPQKPSPKDPTLAVVPPLPRSSIPEKPKANQKPVPSDVLPNKAPDKKEVKANLVVNPDNSGRIKKLPDALITQTNGYLSFKELSVFSRANKHIHKLAQPMLDKEKEARDALIKSMELMFKNSNTAKFAGVDPDPQKAMFRGLETMAEEHELYMKRQRIPAFTPDELTARYEELKKVLKKIDIQHINRPLFFRVEMNSGAATLLIHAINEITDPARRLEIVKILLEKGADPLGKGRSGMLNVYTNVTPLNAAEATRDQELIALIKEALSKYEPSQAKSA
jgi:hypothetical protein